MGEGPTAASGGQLFHLRLRRFPRSAQAFNLTEAQMHDVLIAWAAGRTVEVGEQRWVPAETSITILQSPPLSSDQLTMGRGWSAATRHGVDVTEQLLARYRAEAAQTPAGTRAAHVGDELAARVLALCAAGPQRVSEAWRLAGEHRPDWYAGERLMAAEHALRGLLAGGLVALATAPASGAPGAIGAVLGSGDADAALRDWRTWSGEAQTPVVVVATTAGQQAAAPDAAASSFRPDPVF